MKRCSKCKENKLLDLFHKSSKSKDGHKGICKECSKKYKREHYLKNKEKVVSQVKAYQKENNHVDWKSKRKTIKVSCKHCNSEYIAPKSYYKKGRYQYCSISCSAKAKHNPIDRIISDIRKRANKKGLEFNLDSCFLENLLELQNHRCALSNSPIKIPRFSEITILYKSASVDRIDNSKGYLKGNVQWVVLGINYMKNKFTDDDVLKLINIIKNN